jgi:hypothetical protein
MKDFPLLLKSAGFAKIGRFNIGIVTRSLLSN